MNCEGQHVIVRRAAQIHHAVERSLHEVEWRAKNLRRQFFDRSRPCIVGRNFAKIKIDPATLADHLQGTLSARKDRETQNFLAIDD